jgi:hypothetical protein
LLGLVFYTFPFAGHVVGKVFLGFVLAYQLYNLIFIGFFQSVAFLVVMQVALAVFEVWTVIKQE